MCAMHNSEEINILRREYEPVRPSNKARTLNVLYLEVLLITISASHQVIYLSKRWRLSYYRPKMKKSSSSV